jgi:hypothetical protein
MGLLVYNKFAYLMGLKQVQTLEIQVSAAPSFVRWRLEASLSAPAVAQTTVLHPGGVRSKF